MLFSKLRTKLFAATTALSGIGLAAYYLHKQSNDGSSREVLRRFQVSSTIIALSNNQIAKHYGPHLTSTIQDDTKIKFDNLNPQSRNFSFCMDVRKGKSDEYFDDFAEIQVNSIKIENQWVIDSLDIKFKNSNSTWLKLFEVMRANNENYFLTPNDIETVLNSKNIIDSQEYLKGLVADQPFIIKTIELILKDKQKLNTIGPPIRLLSHDVYQPDPYTYDVKMCIEGTKRNADLLIEAVKSEENKLEWKIVALGIMYDLKDDYILSNSDLAMKYKNDVLNSIQNDKNWLNFLESVNLSKIIEERLLKNSRTVSTIGKPISFKIDLNDSFNSLGENLVKVKLIANGRLNDGELVLNGIRENLSESWKINNSEFKIKWNKNQD